MYKNGIKDDVHKHFNKKYQFPSNVKKWPLPPSNELWTSKDWSDERLLEMKSELNCVKSKLNDKARGPWREHTQSINPSGSIVYKLKSKVNPQLCTQAWAKCYEILANYDNFLFPSSDLNPLQTVHLCEAPGAFITALNHFLVCRYPNKRETWRWIGTTLNPYYEGNSTKFMIADDRFIMHTLDHWDFGYDNTGDIMHKENFFKLEQRAKSMGPTTLVTADGSIDCVKNPSEQENLVARLHYHEMVTALTLLETNGSFVIKLFTSFESSAISLLYLLNCFFEKVELFKPGTSKEGNSEVYAICIGFYKTNFQPYQNALLEIFDTEKCMRHILSRNHIPDEFMTAVYNCAKFFKDIQIEIINRNIEFYTYMSSYDCAFYDCLKDDCRKFYFKNFDVRGISENELIVNRRKMKPLSSDFFPKFLTTCFNDLEARKNLNSKKKSRLMKKELRQLMDKNWAPEEHIVSEITSNDLPIIKPQLEFITEGNSFDQVVSSRFTYQYLLDLWNELQEIIDHDEAGKIFPSTENFVDEFVERSTWILNFESKGVTEKYRQKINLKEIFKKSRGSALGDIVGLRLERFLWIEALLFISENVKANEDVILEVGNLVTRFVVGCLYILTRWFNEMKLVRPPSVSPLDQTVVIIARMYRSADKTVNHFLENVKSRLEKETKDKCILEIIPIPQLICDEMFYNWLYEFNKLKMAQQLHYLLEKMFI